MSQAAITEIDMDVFSRRIGPYFSWLESRIESGWQQSESVTKDVLKEVKYLATTMRARFILGVSRDDFTKEVQRTVDLFELALEAFPDEADEIEAKERHFCKGIAEELGAEFLPAEFGDVKARAPQPEPIPEPEPLPEPEPTPEPDQPEVTVRPEEPKITITNEEPAVRAVIETPAKTVKKKTAKKKAKRAKKKTVQPAKTPAEQTQPPEQSVESPAEKSETPAKPKKPKKRKPFILARLVKNFIYGED